MSYTAALDHLYAKGLELAPSAAHVPRRKFDLDHMRTLAHALGAPQTTFPSILIAGTNGKGSTAATLASILSAAGYRTGLYTSPHLSRINERIRIDDTTISDDDFARLYFRVDTVAEELVTHGDLPYHPSFFETLTAIGFLYFAEQKIDIAVLEVGLGGRLDATNIVEPLLAIITDISLDHQDYLGNTIAEITREKAGILRPHATLITLPQHPEANQAIGEAAAALELHAISAANYVPTAEKLVAQQRGHMEQGTTKSGRLGSKTSEDIMPSDANPRISVDAPQLPRNRYTITVANQPLQVDSPLIGAHQQRNIALAIAAAEELRNPHGYNMLKSNPKSYKISTTAIEQGIRNTVWPGRLELLTFGEGMAPLLLDVAHNPAGAWTLRSAIAHLPESQPRTLLFSCLRDKDLREMAQILLPLFDASSSDRKRDHIVFAPIDSPRAASLEELTAMASELDIPATTEPTLAEAFAEARRITLPDGILVATGSVYLVGEVRALALAAGARPA